VKHLRMVDAGALVLLEERRCVVHDDGCLRRLRLLSPHGVEDEVLAVSQLHSRAIAHHLSVEWRVAVHEGDGEARLRSAAVGGSDNIPGEARGFGGDAGRHG
jgi:hypothetical protein